MFLRKLLVIVVPLVLCGLCVFFLPLLGGFGLWSDLLQGLILGALLALLGAVLITAGVVLSQRPSPAEKAQRAASQ